MARKSRAAIDAPIAEQVSAPIVFQTAIYARLSVENSGKADEGAALENQIEVCKEYLKGCPDLNLIEVYADNGKTGTVFDRPQFNRLMEDIRSGQINCLVVRDLSRFGRDYVETGTYLEKIFPQLDVRFISVKEQYDSFATDGSNESLMIPLQNLINDLYSKDISRKVFTALRIQMENGDYRWRKLPYGYRWNEDKTCIVPDERTAQYVRDIFRWKLEGVSVTAMLERLEGAGAPIPETLQRIDDNLDGVNTICWSKSTIHGMLQNPAYAGDFAVGRSRSAIFAGIKDLQVHDKGEWYITEDTHEGLVSRADFDAVQRIMEQASAERQEKMEKSKQHREALIDLFDKKVFCADCGGRMYFHRKKIDKDKRGRWYAFYECSTAVRRRDVVCTAHYIRQDTLEEKVLSALRLHIDVALNYEEIIARLRESHADKKLRHSMNAAVSSMTIKLRGIGKKRARLYEDFADGILSEEEYAYAKSAYDKQWEEMNRSLDALIERRNSYFETMSPDNKWLRLMGSIKDTAMRSQELVDAAIEKIHVHDDGTIELLMKYHDIYELTGEYIAKIESKEAVAV